MNLEPVPMARLGDSLTVEMWNRMAAICNSLLCIDGQDPIHVTRMNGGTTIAFDESILPTVPDIRVFRITGASPASAGKQWNYTGRLQVKTAAGYGGWTDSVTDGTTYTLRNLAENQHVSSATVYSNGVTVANLTTINTGGGTFANPRIPNETRVVAMLFGVSITPPVAAEWWIINFTTTPDGACPP